MNTAYLNLNEFSFFSDAQEQLNQLISGLQSKHYADSEHGDIEQYINKDGMEILRRLFQGWLDLKAANEDDQEIINKVTGKPLNHRRVETKRTVCSLFGEVIVTRKGYSQRNQPSSFPIDAQLNLSEDKYSDGIRHRLSKEVLRGSFDDAIEVIKETTGGHVPKRQSLNLVRDVAQDFEPFYKKSALSNQRKHLIFSS